MKVFALMLLSIVFMSSFSADSLKYGTAWRQRPHLRQPHFSSGYLEPVDDVICLARRDWADIYSSCKNDAAEILKSMTVNKPNKNLADYSVEGRSKMNGGSMMDRSFGFKFLGFNALANYLINSVSHTTTSTSFSTTYSTLTIGTAVTCYPSELFDTSTPCRRKRESDEIKEKIQKLNPSQVQWIEPSFSDVDIMLLGNGNLFFDDIQRILLEPSIKHDETIPFEEDQDYIVTPRKFGYGEELLENLPGETLYVSTSTITSFSFYTKTTTRTLFTIANFFGDFSCLPDCFTICSDSPFG